MSEQVSGVLEVLQDGYGFLRGENYLSSRNDTFVSAGRIKAMRLRSGDLITGRLSDKIEENKARQLEQVESINGHPVIDSLHRKNFEKMTPIYPESKLKMETEPKEIAGRLIDLLSPVGKGQRGLIISPPKAGKTTLLKSIARSIQTNHPEAHLIILLIDERPEEVTDIKDFVSPENTEVVYSTFDEEPSHHIRVAEMAIERAKALVEMGEDVIILLDSITRLARTYNLVMPSSGKILSGGLDPTSLYWPKHFFGAARNMREGGSLTILATALVETGSRMDDVIFEEFKGTGNMELVLSRDLAVRRIFPAIDVMKSGTRRDELLLSKDELKASEMIRRHAAGLEDKATEDVIKTFKVAKTNDELVGLLAKSKPERK
ncbi:transcription termination factor Rho [Ileibacterium valens]|uniref:Transcription termination factor Rho n=1 Tax=Ileibacterium valens TaxID=1862668 RepID=A0A1U7NET8_9FIRM|nr:transcription termination factor Rho [Ileibacterium valens]OLU38286.1 transcription termination factor Rho [Ileibacterium valens]OLU42502.1 transcription termination factor Rho [Erysipelotrichaceae bacterium NYU-BL-F16]OLU43052.1 transcription termination factor Rho [Erysipelotrichaceae bacterium NYU-BL-E8]